jgi:hypothetical protein
MPLDPLSQLPEEPTTQIPLEFYERRPQPEATAAFLTVLSGANVGMTFPLARGGVLGRSHRADIQLLDHAVSRQHCRLEEKVRVMFSPTWRASTALMSTASASAAFS